MTPGGSEHLRNSPRKAPLGGGPLLDTEDLRRLGVGGAAGPARRSRAP